MARVVGVETPEKLVNPGRLGYPDAYTHTSNGDGAVTIDSALMAESAQYVTACAHGDLPYYLAAGGQLAAWVLDPRITPAPPPPPAVLAQQFPALLAGPPLTRAITGVPSGRAAMIDC